MPENFTTHLNFTINNSTVYVYNVPEGNQYLDHTNDDDINEESGTQNVGQESNSSSSSPQQNVPFNSNVLLTPSMIPTSNINQPIASPLATSMQQAAQQYSNWINSLRPNTLNSVNEQVTSEDSSGNDVRIQQLTDTIQSILQIPTEHFHIEFLDSTDVASRHTSVSQLFSGSSLMLVPPESVGPENEPCAICRNNYNEGDIVRKLNSCNHYFHARCVEEWFQTHNNCPVCRSQL